MPSRPALALVLRIVFLNFQFANALCLCARWRLALVKYLARVSPRFLSPHWAVRACVGAAQAVGLWTPVYSAMAALRTLALYASYALPIGLGFWARGRGVWTTGAPWDLGRWSRGVNVVALGWIAIITVLFVLLPNQLAGYTFVGSVLHGLFWIGYMRRRFRGPLGPRIGGT